MSSLHCLKLVYRKKYFNLAKIFILKLFKSIANQIVFSKIEQRTVTEFLLTKKFKPGEIYRSKWNVCADTRCRLKDLTSAMADRDEW